MRRDAQMQLHHLPGEFAVTGSHRRGEVAVMLQALHLVLQRADEVRADHDRHVDEARQHRPQARRAAAFQDGPMEAGIDHLQALGKRTAPLRDGAVHLLVQLVQPIRQRDTPSSGRQFGRVRLEQAAQFEGLLDVELGPFRDAHAAIRVGRGQPVVDEALERGADRRAADLQLAGEVLLLELRTGRIGAPDHALLEDVVSLVGCAAMFVPILY